MKPSFLTLVVILFGNLLVVAALVYAVRRRGQRFGPLLLTVLIAFALVTVAVGVVLLLGLQGGV